MIYRLRYCNKDGVEARVDIQKGLATPVIDVEGTERPFILSYNNDKGDKSGMFLSSSADIEIYETTDFNIDNLKTSNETELSVTHYINNVVSWQGFIIPDFFSIEVRNNPVITMTASDRIGTLKNVTLSDLPSMISLRELAILCLNKTGLTLPLRTMADFNNGTGVNDFFNSKILTQRLSDTKGRSISCYDVLSSILTASNSFLTQRNGEWYIVNKYQHEIGSGELYNTATTSTNWSEVIHDFSEITVGGRRTIVPVGSSVGVYQEFGGGRIHPENYDFLQDLTGWNSVGGFVASIDNRKVDTFTTGSTGQAEYKPVYGAVTEKKYLVNFNEYLRNENPIYLESNAIPIFYSGSGSVTVSLDINAIGPAVSSIGSFPPAYLRVAIIATNGTKTKTLDYSGKFIDYPSINPPVFISQFDMGEAISPTIYKALSKGMAVSGALEVEDDLSLYSLKIRIYGGGGGRTVLINSVGLTIKSGSKDNPKGTIYKSEQGSNFTKTHDLETSIFGDYLTNGLNGYFYDYPKDDTSSLFNNSGVLTNNWTTPTDTEELPLLQHISRQKARMFSVAHDLLTAEIEVVNFDPLAIFRDCDGKRYSIVTAEVDFFNAKVNLDIEQIIYDGAILRRDFIYSYFGDGEKGVQSIGGVSAGSGGGGSGGGLTPEQLEILSFWKKDPVNPNTIFTEMNAYSKLELSAYGVGEGGGSGGSDYERLDTWASYDSSKAEWVLSAFLGNDLNTRVTNLENSGGGGGGSTVEWGTLTNGYRQLTVEGVTYSLAQNTHKHLWADITDKPSTFTPSAHSHGWSEITGKPSTFAPSAHTHSAGDITSGTFSIARIPTGTTSGTVAEGNDSRIINGQTAFGWGNHSGLYLPLTGGTMANTNLVTNLNADLLDGIDSAYFKKGVGLGSYYRDVVNVSSHTTVYEILIKTKIPFISSSQMPLIHLEGYVYGAASPIDLRVAFYIYNSSFANPGCTSTCPWKPTIKMFTYLDGTTRYVGIALIQSIYYPQFTVNYIDVWGGSSGVQSRNYSEGWSYQVNTVASPTIVPTDNLTIVPYKPIANDITGNAATATTLATARTIAGVSFDGTANIAIPFANLSSKPTTLAGYGITNAYTKTEVDTALDGKLNKSVFDDLFEKVEVSTGVFAIKAKYSFYSTGEVSAYGIGSGGGGGSYDRLDAWADYDSTKSGWVLSALLGNELNTRVGNLEGGSALTVNTTGTGNAITSISKAGTVITATKGATFSLDNHLHAGVYEPVFTKNTAFNKNFGTASGTVAQGNDSRIINGQTAYGWGNHASAGYALNSSLSNYLPLTGGTLTGNVIAPTFEGSIITPSGVEYLRTLNTAISEAGWYRVFVGNASNISGPSVILNVDRLYAINSNESYTFSINVAYNGAISITQLSGIANVRGIPKIRVDYVNGGVLAVDIYYSLNSSNRIYISGSGTGKFQTPTLVTAPTGTTVEFDTVDGVKSNIGFTGSLTGNASSATKLQTARTIAGVSFDGTANIAIPFANLSSKPTTLGGYGITDAVTLNTAQTITGAKTFTASVTAPTFIGALNGNAATATKLQTARTIWGQSFKGDANVSGAMTGVTTLAMTGALSGATTIQATISVASPKVIFNAAGWSMEQVGSELQMKHNNVLKMRFTSTGSIIATEEITAFA